MRMRALASLAILLGGVASAGPLVHWRAPAGCPGEAEIEGRVAARLGSDASTGAPIEVVVQSTAGGFVAQIGDARTLRSASCAELADAAALVVARLVLEEPAIASVAVAPLAPILGLVAPPPSPPDPMYVLADRRSPTRPVRHELAIGLRLSALTGGGVQPGVAFGGELAVPLFWRELFIEPAGELWTRSTSSGAMGGVAAALRAASLRAGWRGTALPVRAWLVVDVGPLTGKGVDVTAPRTAAATWAGAGAGAAFVQAVARGVAVVASGEAMAAISRPRFALSDGDLVYQPDPVALRLAVGLEVAWP